MIAEGRGEDDLAAFAGEALKGLFGIGFRHVFGIGGFNLVAEFLLHGFKALMVLVGPAKVADGADIDPAGLQRFGRGGSRRRAQHQCSSCSRHQIFLHVYAPC